MPYKKACPLILDNRKYVSIFTCRSNNAGKPSEGYTALWERKRLDITVEALVQDPKWATLFTQDEIKKARQRLIEYGYVFK